MDLIIAQFSEYLLFCYISINLNGGVHLSFVFFAEFIEFSSKKTDRWRNNYLGIPIASRLDG
jgi:hypothetical protein